MAGGASNVKTESIITMPRMIPSVIVKIANRMKLIGKLLKRIS